MQSMAHKTAVHAVNVIANVESIASAPPGKRWPHVLRAVVIAGVVEGMSRLFNTRTR